MEQFAVNLLANARLMKRKANLISINHLSACQCVPSDGVDVLEDFNYTHTKRNTGT